MNTFIKLKVIISVKQATESEIERQEDRKKRVNSGKLVVRLVTSLYKHVIRLHGLFVLGNHLVEWLQNLNMF